MILCGDNKHYYSSTSKSNVSLRISSESKVTVGGEHRRLILSLSLELACDYSTPRLIAGNRVFMEVITIKTKTSPCWRE